MMKDHIMNCRYEIKVSYDPCSYERNFCNCAEKPEKFRTLRRLTIVLGLGSSRANHARDF